MVFILRANQRNYVVSEHAAKRMIERFISEELIVAVLEYGTVIDQPHGRVLYEHSVDDEIIEGVIIIGVVVDETTNTIVTVIDNTEEL